jgi:non-homologous end joining protein Ku
MAQRSLWSGKLQVNALFGADVSVVKASDAYEGDESFREVSECHHEPFRRVTTCPVCDKRRLTREMEAAGDTANTTRLVKAVQRGTDYFVVSDDQIKQINAAVSSKVIQALYRVPFDHAPLEQIAEAYYVRAQLGSEGNLAAIHYALGETGECLVAQWTPRTRPRLVIIHPTDDSLVLNAVRYPAEIVQPEPEVMAHLAFKPSDEELALAIQLIGTLSNKVKWDAFEDESVAIKAKIIAAVTKGKPVPTVAGPTAAPAPAADMMAQLQAALAATQPPGGGVGRGRKPAAKKVAAPAPRGTRKAAAEKKPEPGRPRKAA